MHSYRISEAQIIETLCQVAEGQLSIQAACQHHRISEDTFNRWRYTYGDWSTPAQRAQLLEQENLQLRRLLAERELQLA